MLHAPAEVTETEADGKVKEIYADIKQTLRIPSVGRLFRMLAIYPDYLHTAWRGLKPNVQTLYFETAADAIRAHAVEGVDGFSQLVAPPDDARSTIRAFHYAGPKLFLVAATLRAATSGQQPKLTEIPPGEKQQLVAGVPDGMEMVNTQNENRIDNALEADIIDTLRAPAVDDLYLGLAQWPDYVESSWRAWKQNLASVEFRRLRRTLQRTADETITGLPFRIDIGPHSLRLTGHSERQIDGIRAVLIGFHGAGVPVVAHAAALCRSMDGKDGARESPFPPSLQ